MDRKQRAIRDKISRIGAGTSPRVLDLFAGCGGLSLGFHKAGFKIAAAVEFDLHAAQSHGRNFHGGDPSHSAQRDITKTSPDSLVQELNLGGVAEPLGITPLIVGAFARDLHLLYGRGIETLRQTEDIDFALALQDWSAFDALQERLIETARFSPSPTAAHRLRHRNGLPIDLVPFGSVETRERKIAWPPRGEVVMDVF